MIMSRVRPLLTSSCISLTQEAQAFREVRVSRETHDASRQISTGIEIHGTTVRFTVKQSFRRASNRSDFRRTRCCGWTSQIYIGRALETTSQININSTVGHKGALSSIGYHRRKQHPFTSRGQVCPRTHLPKCSRILF